MRPLLALIPLALLLLGCIEGEETTWLERDGSGRLEATYLMPPLVMRSFGGPEQLATTLREAAARDPHVNLTRIVHRTEKGRVIFEFAGAFDDLRNLCTFPQRQLREPARPDTPVEAEALFGVTTLDLNPRGIFVHRSIDISGVLPKNIQRTPAILGDSSFHYILHLPVKVKQTNATATTDHGRTVEWTFLLKEHVSTPMILTAEAPVPIPHWIWLLAGALAAALAIVIVRILKHPRQSVPTP